MVPIGRGGASHIRRLITRISVGWRPLYLHPSGACLTRGTSRPGGLVTPSRVAPHRGCASAARRGKPSAVWGQWPALVGLTVSLEPVCAMAQIKPASSRAMATTTGFACLPRASKRRARVHRRTGAFQRRSGMVWGGGSSRRGECRLTLAGYRSAQAPSTRARRAWGFPAVVIEPCRRRAPREDSAGIRPRYFIRGLGVSTRVQVSARRHEGHGPSARHATQGLKGLDHRRQSPGFDLFRPCLPEALEPCGVLMDGATVCLEDDGLSRGGAAHVGEPPPMGRAPGRATRRAEIVAEPKGVETTRGGLESGEGLFPSPAEVTTGFVFPRRHIDGGEVT